MAKQKAEVGSYDQLVEVFKQMKPYLEEHGKVVIEWDKAGRSIDQNSLFHKWCLEFAWFLTDKGRPCGMEEAKALFKAKFLGFEDVPVGNKVIKDQLKHTSNCTVGEMYHFMEQVWEYAAMTYDCYLTVPDHSQFKRNRDKANGQA